MRSMMLVVPAAGCAVDPAATAERRSEPGTESPAGCGGPDVVSISNYEPAAPGSTADDQLIIYAPFPAPAAEIRIDVEAPSSSIALRLSLVDENSGDEIAASLLDFNFAQLLNWDDETCSGWTAQRMSLCADSNLPFCGDDEACVLDGDPLRVDAWVFDLDSLEVLPTVEALGEPTGSAWFTAKVTIPGC